MAPPCQLHEPEHVRGRPPEPARKLQVWRPVVGVENIQRSSELRWATAGRWNCMRSRTAVIKLARIWRSFDTAMRHTVQDQP